MDASTRELVAVRLARCHDDLATASLLMREGRYRAAVSRAYYAIFIVAAAALATLGVSGS